MKKASTGSAEGKKVALKLPEGFMPHAESILHFLHQHGMDVTLLAESCYGACDFVTHDGIDRILCIGEAEMPYLRKIYRPPVSFIEVWYEFDERLLEKVLPHLSEKRWVLRALPHSFTPYPNAKYFWKKKDTRFSSENGAGGGHMTARYSDATSLRLHQ